MQFKHYVGLSDVKREIIMVFLGILLLATTAHAADAQNTDSCYANYFAEKGELVIPCVDVIDPSGMVQSYEVTLNQLSATDGSLQFGLKEWQVSQSDIVAIQEGSSCRAVYSVEQGNLLMPCVNVVDLNGQAEAYQVVMNQLNSNLVEVFKLGVAEANKIETNESSTRSARAGFFGFGGIINLTVSGAGKVTSPIGSCSGTQKKCSWSSSGLMTKLTAIPDNGKQFIGWGGEGCSGTATSCTVFLAKQTKSVTATFTSATTTQKPVTPPPPATQLVITISGADGSNTQVVGNKGNINCANSCTYKITSPVVLSLKSYKFGNGGNQYEIDTWDGSACRGNATTCTIVPTGQAETVYVNLKVYLARMESSTKLYMFGTPPPPPNGWIIETVGSSMTENKGTLGAKWGDVDILYNVMNPPIGTKVRTTVALYYTSNVAGWNRVALGCGEIVFRTHCKYEYTKYR